jgi:hypothetical protein
MNHWTQSQKGAMYIWFEQCAHALNKAGLFRHGVLDYKKIYPWDKMTFKHYIYKPALLALTGKMSTEHQSTIEPSDVYLAISGQIATMEDGIQLPEWPSNR